MSRTFDELRVFGELKFRLDAAVIRKYDPHDGGLRIQSFGRKAA